MNLHSVRSNLNPKIKGLLTVLSIAVLIAVMLPSCGEESSSPSNVIPRKTFIKLMAEVELVSSFQNYTNDSTAAAMLQDSVFNHYNVTVKEFRATEQYYQQRPEIYKTIIDSALEHFSETQATLSGIQNQPNE